MNATRIFVAAVLATLALATSAGGGTTVDIDRKVDVGGYGLFLSCHGSGSPTVVLESGFAESKHNWTIELDSASPRPAGRSSSDVVRFGGVQSRVVATTQVCVYDRAGLGFSDRGPGFPTTAGRLATELRTLLANAGVRGPYVLVGHSFGGMVSRLFATRYASEVRGLVLVDSTQESNYPRPGIWGDCARWCVDMGRTLDEMSASPLERGALGSLPLVVIRRGMPYFSVSNLSDTEWPAKQAALASLSTRSVHVVARRAGHYIQVDQPELVGVAVQQVVAAVRASKPLALCGAAYENAGGTCVSAKPAPRCKESYRLVNGKCKKRGRR